MTTIGSDAKAAETRPSAPGAVNEWNKYVPKSVTFADSMSEEESKRVWMKMYEAAGLGQAGEDKRKMLRAAVYVYCCKNGTSREGEYKGTFALTDGTVVECAVIPRAAGKMMIRKFLRSNMKESYEFFKTTGVMEQDARFVSKAAQFGVSADVAFATADWMDSCPYFTPAESRAHESVFTKSIDRARRARNGNSLEQVEDNRINDTIRANGPGVASESGDKFSF